MLNHQFACCNRQKQVSAGENLGVTMACKFNKSCVTARDSQRKPRTGKTGGRRDGIDWQRQPETARNNQGKSGAARSSQGQAGTSRDKLARREFSQGQQGTASPNGPARTARDSQGRGTPVGTH